jgi:hypothetical protein
MLATMTETQAKWLKRCEEWKASGLGAEQFTEGKDYRASSLKWYLRQLKQAGLLRAAVSAPAPTAAGRGDRDSSRKTRWNVAAAPSARMTRRCDTGKQQGAGIPIARVVRSTAAQARGVIVEIGQARINVCSGFDASLLKDVVRALQGSA